METSPPSRSLLRYVADLVAERYVLPADAHAIAAHLRGVHWAPDPDSDPEGFAETATTLLRAKTHDRHLSVRYRPEGVQDEQDDATWERWYASQARVFAGGVVSVSRDADIATVQIGPSLSPVEYARPYLDAAMQLVDGADFLVLDVRGCHGGTPDAVEHVCSYFLGPSPLHLQDVVERNGAIQRFFTDPDRLAAPPQPELPIAVLTSAATFSGGEDLAYTLQAFRRAVVVGEQTGGGAHPKQAFPLTSTLEAHVPVARSISAITGGNWEGTGVPATLPCPSSEARTNALAPRARTLARAFRRHDTGAVGT